MIRVFLVEDQRGVHALLSDLLEVEGSIQLVGSATSEGEAKLWLDEHAGLWDAAIIDLVLQAGSGFGVIQHAATTHPSGRIAVFSGYLTPGVRQHCTNLGASQVFDKTDNTPLLAWLSELASGPSS